MLGWLLPKRTCPRCGTEYRGKQPWCTDDCRLAEQREQAQQREAERRQRKLARRDATLQPLLEAEERGEVMMLEATFGEPEHPQAVGFVGGLPGGITPATWPSGEDGPMLHLVTLDLTRLPGTRPPAAGLTVFLELLRDGEFWTPTGAVKVQLVSTVCVDPSLADLDPARIHRDHLKRGAVVRRTGVPPEFNLEHASALSYAGGWPLSFETEPLGQRLTREAMPEHFIAQLGGACFDDGGLELEELAAVYVFATEAIVDTYS